jgi:hypothetical protein
MKVKTYIPRIKSVAAVQLQVENITDVAEWSEAGIVQPGNHGFSGACIKLPNGERARSGDWIVRGWSASGRAPHFYVVDNIVFEKEWEEGAEYIREDE